MTKIIIRNFNVNIIPELHHKSSSFNCVDTNKFYQKHYQSPENRRLDYYTNNANTRIDNQQMFNLKGYNNYMFSNNSGSNNCKQVIFNSTRWK